METVNFQCGHCGKLMGVNTAFLGQQVHCPHCQQVVVAPAAAPGSIDATWAGMPANSPGAIDETAILQPASSGIPAPLSKGGTDYDLFRDPSPPHSQNAPTARIEPPKAPPTADVDATVVHVPAPGSSPSSAAIPDWMMPEAEAEPQPIPTETAP